MTQVATVKQLIGKNRAVISVPRQSSCGGDCAGCAGCGATATPILAEAVNLIHAQPGQKVIVESSTGKTLGIAVLVYIVPIILFLAGYLSASALTESVTIQYAMGGLLFLAGIALAIFYDRYIQRQGGPVFQIMELF